MCSNPQTLETGDVIACRKCNECISMRKNDWVARAMAEASVSKEVMALTLTYRNTRDGTLPAKAVVFDYKDVQDFLKRLRTAYKDHYGKTGEIRYVVAGEQGSQKKRVHWHMILFSERPLAPLGKWTKLYGAKEDKRAFEFSYDRRRHWSMWDHGFVYAQRPDQQGVAYVMKYAIKDQFNVQNSKGTAREHKAEVYGAGMFRMSKEPAIGARFIDKKLAEWATKGVVPSSLQLKVPDYSGYWYPKRDLRQRLLLGIHNINAEAKRRTGKDLAGMRPLLMTIDQILATKDWETLTYGEIEDEETEFDLERFRRELEEDHERQRAIWEAHERKPQNRCGGILPCKACWRVCADDPKSKAAFKEWYFYLKDQYVVSSRHALDVAFRSERRPNPFCQFKDTDEVQRAFRDGNGGESKKDL